jgi:uncharacterized membrane protein YqjE
MNTEDEKTLASLLLDIYSQTVFTVFEIHGLTLLLLVALRWLISDMTDWQFWITTALFVITLINSVSTFRKSYKLSKLSDEIKGI